VARYVARVRTSLPIDEAFDLLADMRHFADWDPGVRSVDQVVGRGAGPGSTFDLHLALVPYPRTLRYATEQFDKPSAPDRKREALLVARDLLFTSIDRVSAEPDGDAVLLVYDAEFRFNGPLRLGDLGLWPVFGWIARRADAGLRSAVPLASVAA
jgi:hypothetical protein